MERDSRNGKSRDVQSDNKEDPYKTTEQPLDNRGMYKRNNIAHEKGGEVSTLSRVVAWSFKYGPRVGGGLMLLATYATVALGLASFNANIDMVNANTEMVKVNTAQLKVSQDALREAHEQDRRQNAIEQQRQWDIDSQYARASIKALWPDETESGKVIPVDKILAQVKRERKRGVVVTVDYHFNTILNLLERVAQSVNAGVVHEPLAKEAFREQVMKWVAITSDLRAYREQQRGGVPGFTPLMALHKRWSEEPVPAVTLPPTGVSNP